MNRAVIFLWLVFVCVSPLVAQMTPGPVGQPRVTNQATTNAATNVVTNGTTNAVEARGTPSFRLAGAHTIVFESFDRVSVRDYEEAGIQEVLFTGNVRIIFDGRRLFAQRVYITIQDNETVLQIAAFGQVQFHDGQAFYLAESFFFEPERRTGRMLNVRSYMRDVTGMVTAPGFFYRAAEVQILSDTRAVFKQAYLTFTPADVPHYELFAERVWYFRDHFLFSLHNSYRVGGGNFFYFPFFLRLERVTGVRTSAGIERRLGWYVMNTFDWAPRFGNVQMGLDFYERMGEYGFVRYVNTRPIGILQQIRFFGELANDVRLFFDPVSNRYTQWRLINNEWVTIRQLAWRYTLEGTLVRDNFSLSFYTEDLNDPFFSKKYGQRRETFNFQNILQPEENVFFAQSDDQPGFPTLNRRFSISSPQFTLSGQWMLERTRNFAEPNIYLNNAYRYYLRNVSFPNITYSLPTLMLLENANFQTYSYETNRVVLLSPVTNGAPPAHTGDNMRHHKPTGDKESLRRTMLAKQGRLCHNQPMGRW